MNGTNRALNRVILIVVGLVMLALGSAVVAVFAWPAAAELWTNSAETGRTWIEDTLATTVRGASAASVISIIVLVLIVVLLVLLVITLARLGGGRSRNLLSSGSSDNPVGRVSVRPAFVSDALQHSLKNRDEVLFSHVTASDVRKQPVMHISVTPRQNTSPRLVLDDVDRLATNLATLTGEEVPTYISIHSGLRAKLAHDQRRLA